MRTMLLFLIIFAFSIAIATFIENDFSNDAARKLIYNARWFEILLILGMINIVAVIVKQKLYRPEKLTLFVFHVAFVIVILGAGITRYFGREGIVHIREGDTAKNWITTDTYLELLIEKNGHQYSACYPVLFSEISKNRFRKKISFEGSHIHLSVKNYILHAEKRIEYKPGGKPFVHMITASGQQKIITSGEKIASGDVFMFFLIPIRIVFFQTLLSLMIRTEQ